MIIKAVDGPNANDDVDFDGASGTGDGGHRSSFACERDHTVYIKSLITRDQTETLKLDHNCVLLYLTTRV